MENRNYKSVLQDFTTTNENVRTILSRGLLKCYKPIQEGPVFLLTGINPSFNVDKHEVWPGELRVCNISAANDGYWLKKRKQFGKIWDNMQYLDLFPIREVRQQNGFEKSFKEETVFRRDLLMITQSEIESMKPKLIVHANKDSIYYWGIMKNTPIGGDANDYENPWMGYKVKRVTEKDYPDLPPCMRNDRLELFPFYRIEGFQKSEKRINREKYPETSSLEGCFLLEYVMDGRNKRYNGKLYQEKEEGPKEWTEIWEWVNRHKQ